MLITLLRHGEVAGRAQVLRGQRDEPLSARGWQQMQRVWQASTPPFSHLVSSPLLRCAEFARQQSQTHQLPLTMFDELREIDFGHWDNLTLTEAEQSSPDCFHAFQHDTWNWCPPAGEPYRLFRQRVQAVIPRLQQLATSHALVITHGGVIRALLAEWLDLSPASVARFGVPQGGYCQLWLSDHAHDQPRASLLRLNWLDPICS